jgi:hypothetical protein
MNVRRKWQSVVWVAAVVCGMVMAGTSRAAVVYEYVPDQQSYQINGAGGFVTVLLYLKETLTNGSTSLITSDGGMLGAGIGVSRLATGLPPSPSVLVTDASGITRNTVDFTGPGGVSGSNGDGNPSATDLTFNEAIGPPPAQAVQLGNTAGGTAPSVANEIYIGSIKIQGGTQQGTTTFAVRIHDNVFYGNTLTRNSFLDLDVDNNGGATPVYSGAQDKTNSFTVTVNVPEPASFGLLFGAGALGLIRRRRI